MFIISDNGKTIVNAEQAFSFDTAEKADGSAIIAFGPGFNSVLCVGSSQRCDEALDAIRKAHKEGWKILDLRDKLGQRPNLQVAQLHLPPNGGGPVAG